MPKYKIARIASDIQRYLGDIIINDVNDEILKSITITGTAPSWLGSDAVCRLCTFPATPLNEE